MKYVILVVASLMLVFSGLACCCIPFSVPVIDVPDIDIDIPEVDVGPVEEYDEQISADGVEEARVDIFFGAGDIDLMAGDPDLLLDAQFRTNVAEWVPEVTWDDGVLRVDHPNMEGIPNASNVENEWTLAFSPDVALEMDIEMGASDGSLDFTGLALTDLYLDTGAADLDVFFNEPNPVDMGDIRVRAGAANLDIEHIGNANPEEVQVDGGVGDMTLDFTGEWTHSAEIRVTAGTGSINLSFPEGVGVRVEVEGGLSSVDTDGQWSRSGNDYVNSAYGESDIELIVEVTLGLGSLDLDLVGE
jgi:hypothetical protein